MFSSGELPDVIFYNVYGYPGGPQAMVADGIIEPLNEYMEYAPNLQAVLDDRENVKNTHGLWPSLRSYISIFQKHFKWF